MTGCPWVCTACGAHFPNSKHPPDGCPLCEDDRGTVPPSGPVWAALDELRLRHRTKTELHEPKLTGIGSDPYLAIGQRALLVQTSEGNVLWDCIPLIDDDGADHVRSLGGLEAVAVSHPHFYSAMTEWSEAFGDVPIFIHAADRNWVTRPDPAIVYWEGETQSLPGGLTLIRCGGHFDGATILLWPDGADGRGVILTGDVMAITPDRHVSFMHAYPNLIPLSERKVERLVQSVEPYAFDRIYGGWFWTRIESNAKEVISRSAARYLAALRA